MKGENVQTFVHPCFRREGFNIDTISRRNAKSIKKGKGEIIQELQLVAVDSLKRSRDVQTKNEELEQNNVALERENHRLTSLLHKHSNQVEDERIGWVSSYLPPGVISPLVMSPKHQPWSISPDNKKSRTFCDDMADDDIAIFCEKRIHDSAALMDVEPDWLSDNEDVL